MTGYKSTLRESSANLQVFGFLNQNSGSGFSEGQPLASPKAPVARCPSGTEPSPSLLLGTFNRFQPKNEAPQSCCSLCEE